MNPGDGNLRAVPISGKPPEIPEEIVRFASLPAERRELFVHVHALLEEIVYGTVVIVVQDGKVLQIETSEKIRLR